MQHTNTLNLISDETVNFGVFVHVHVYFSNCFCIVSNKRCYETCVGAATYQDLKYC